MNRINIRSTRPALRGLVLALAATVLASYVATATPYATCLTNTAGTVSFRLNEAADTVKVIWAGGASVTNLGAKARGLTVTNLGVVTSPFQVQVIKTGTGTIATNNQVAFNSVRGVAVNFNPKSPNFGRMFAGNTVAGTKGQGIYVHQSDFTDIFGAARTGGIGFGAGGSAPWRLAIGEDDDQLYAADWTDNNGNLYVTDQDVTSYQYALQQLGPCLDGTTNSATDTGNPPGYGNNHGSVAAVTVFGSTANSNLTIITVDEDLQDDRASTAATQMNSVWRYDLGTNAFPSLNADFMTNRLITPEIQYVSNVEGLSHGSGGTNGYLYYCEGRASGNEPGVFVITNVFTAYQYAWNNANVWNSKAASAELGSVTDILLGAVTCSVSRDGRWLASINYQNNRINIVRLTNGIPDLSRRVQFTGLGTTASGRDIAFDAADNLIYSSSGLGFVYHISLGLSATNTTGSDGTFNLGVLPVVSVVARTNIAHRTDINGSFTFYRDGDLSAPLKAFYTVTGTATNGINYTAILSNITFAAGASSTNLTIAPIESTPNALPSQSVIITLTATPASYNLVEAKAATVWIADNKTPLVSWARNYINMYEREPLDWCRFTITRTGETNASFTIPLSYGGTGVLGTDFTGPSSVTLNAGVISQVVEWFPLANGAVEGTLNPNPNLDSDVVNVPPLYNIASSSSNQVFNIIDSDLAPETVLWADDFSAYVGSGTNVVPSQWTFLFGSTNNVADYSFEFGHEYSASFPLAPGASSYYSLKATVNKFDAIPTAAALNFYPTNQFSGSYALRFSMLQVLGTVNNTEHALFGIDHSGSKTNWNRSGGFINTYATNQDGVWFSVSSSINSGWDDCMWTAGTGASVTSPAILSNITGNPSAIMIQVFKNYSLANGPYAAFGASGCAFNGAKNWVDVEVANTPNLVTLKLNNQVILQQTNITAFQAGKVMLGYNDMFDSTGEATNTAGGAAVYFANARVISISAPAITVQPVAGQAVVAGGSVTLTVVASTTTGVTNYQWFKNGVLIAGATSATLTLANFQSANAGAYYVVVGDGTNFAASQTSKLTLATAPKITPVLSGSTLNMSFPSQVGPTYYMEWKGELTNGVWNPLSTNSGTGSTITVPDGPVTVGSRFYRIRLQ
jgi:hypothetical protein